QYNGIKLCRAGARPVSEDSGLVELRGLAERILAREALAPVAEPGSVTRREMLAEYAAFLRGLVDLSAMRPLKAVVDAGNRTAGLTVPAVLGTEAGLPAVALEIGRANV